MRALLQRVSRAEVRVDGEVVGACGRGLLILVGIGRADDADTAQALARRVVELRSSRTRRAGRTARSSTSAGRLWSCRSSRSTPTRRAVGARASSRRRCRSREPPLPAVRREHRERRCPRRDGPVRRQDGRRARQRRPVHHLARHRRALTCDPGPRSERRTGRRPACRPAHPMRKAVAGAVAGPQCAVCGAQQC